MCVTQTSAIPVTAPRTSRAVQSTSLRYREKRKGEKKSKKEGASIENGLAERDEKYLFLRKHTNKSDSEKVYAPHFEQQHHVIGTLVTAAISTAPDGGLPPRE